MTSRFYKFTKIDLNAMFPNSLERNQALTGYVSIK